MQDHADISLLFNFFVTSQRLRRVLAEAMAESGMRPDEYAVYSLMFEKGPMTATQLAEFLGMPLSTVLDYVKEMSGAGHIVRTSHPFDGRAQELSLNRAGVAAHKRAHASWEVVRKRIEGGLSMSIKQVSGALRALDESAERAGRQARQARAQRSGRIRRA